MTQKNQYKLNVNGQTVEVTAEPRELLIYTLREQLNITGPHIGCETSHCGACTVTIDGKSVKSCTMFVAQAEGKEITTIEGLGGPDALHLCKRPLKSITASVWILHAGHDHPCDQIARGESQPIRRGNPLWHGRKHLPLHRIPEHREIHSGRRGRDECSQGGRRMKDEVTSREDRIDSLKGMGCSRKRVEDARFTQG